MIVPQARTASFGDDKGRTPAEFAYYAVSDGQQQAEARGYAPLPVNLLQAASPRSTRSPVPPRRSVVLT
jgi:phosphate transport system substrate-binding protein